MTLDPFSEYEKKILRLEKDNRALSLGVQLMASLVDEADHLAGCDDEYDADCEDGEYDDRTFSRVDRCNDRQSMLAEVLKYLLHLMTLLNDYGPSEDSSEGGWRDDQNAD